MNKSRQVTEGAMMIAILMVMLIASLFPILSLITIFVLPVPFIFYVKRHGVKAGLIMTLAVIVISSLLMSPVMLPLLLIAAAGGTFIGYAMSKGNTAYETLAQGTFGFLVGMLLAFIFSQTLLDVNIVAEYENIVEESVNTSATMVESINPSLGEEDMEMLQETQINLLQQLIPTFMVVFALITAFITQWISYKLFNRIGNEKLAFPPFRQLQFPSVIIWIYLLALILSVIGFEEGSTMNFGVQNLLMIVGIALSLQGFSFIFYFAYIKKIAKAVPILIVVATVLFPGFLLYFVRILGIIDIGFRLRERLK
ncbi:YybS family protein [Oceanobacillus jeddahense]|uniref:YybS family protein n=1 Tax=Oceanobacillus jeddahense TaxID=1462527 RepID=A0ABY5JVE6_9BACI|nr:YybS family protein [Oceanobacillus jeddahense]UUI03128.1 YybS family protein [Oceanobacillus jeddahense]